MRKKLGEIVNLNVFFAMLVIFIHVSSSPVTTLAKDGFAYVFVMTLWRFSGFAVPGFLFLSSLKMFVNMKENFSYKKFYKSRFFKIVLPYVFWVIVFYVYFYLRGYFPENQNHFKSLSENILLGNLVAHFYFIVVIVQFYLLAPLWIFIKNHVNKTLALAVSFLIMILSQYIPKFFADFNITFIYNDRLFTTYIFYWVLGIYAGANYEGFKNMLKSKTALFAVLFAAFLILDTRNYYLSSVGISVKYIELVRKLYCISAIMFFYGLSLKDEKTHNNKIIKAIDNASYYIYLSHCLFIFEIDRIMQNANITKVRFTYPIRFIFVYAVCILMCTGYVFLKKKARRHILGE